MQSLGLQNRVWLQPGVIDRGLNSSDRAELQHLVQPERWQHEAEARVMPMRSLSEHIQAMSEACSDWCSAWLPGGMQRGGRPRATALVRSYSDLP